MAEHKKLGKKEKKRLAQLEEASEALGDEFSKILRRYKRKHGRNMRADEVAMVAAVWATEVVFQVAPSPSDAFRLLLTIVAARLPQQSVAIIAPGVDEIKKALSENRPLAANKGEVPS